MTGMQKAVGGSAFATTAAVVFVVRAWLTDDRRDIVHGLVMVAVFAVLFVAVIARARYEAKRDRLRKLKDETRRI